MAQGAPPRAGDLGFPVFGRVFLTGMNIKINLVSESHVKVTRYADFDDQMWNFCTLFYCSL